MVLKWSARLLFVIGAVSLSWYVYVSVHSRIVQALGGAYLDKVVSNGVPGHEPRAASVSAGGLIGRIEIPRVGISSIILQGIDDSTLGLGVGHIDGTAVPGEPGNVGLAGHRDTFFRPLREIQSGDAIKLTTLDGTYEYIVDWFRVVGPDETKVLDRSGGEHSLTLVTCFPFYYIGSAPRRFVVRAHLSTVATPEPVQNP
jgi:sortase A